LNPEPTTQNPQPRTHNPEPTTHNPQPTTHNVFALHAVNIYCIYVISIISELKDANTNDDPN
jgi:hypothetical protein